MSDADTLQNPITLKNQKKALNISESLPSLKLNGKYPISPIINSTHGLPVTSTYQLSYNSPKSMDILNLIKEEGKLNAKKMKREMHDSISIIKSSTYKVYFLNFHLCKKGLLSRI